MIVELNCDRIQIEETSESKPRYSLEWASPIALKKKFTGLTQFLEEQKQNST